MACSAEARLPPSDPDCPAGYICSAKGLPESCEDIRNRAIRAGMGDIHAGMYCPAGSSGLWNCPVGNYCPTSVREYFQLITRDAAVILSLNVNVNGCLTVAFYCSLLPFCRRLYSPALKNTFVRTNRPIITFVVILVAKATPS